MNRHVYGPFRYYAVPDQLAAFLLTITSQLISSCRACISAPGKIWDQPKPHLIANLEAAVALRDTYVAAFRYQQSIAYQCLLLGHAAHTAEGDS